MRHTTTTASPSSLAPYLKNPAWTQTGKGNSPGPEGDVVLSARARLARNLAEYPFPGRAGGSDLRRIAQEVRRAALADTERLADLTAISMSGLSERDRAELEDARRISPELARAGGNRYALLDDEGLLSIFVNEEDHVRIQALAPGNALHAALLSAEDADARLARRLTYARSSRWGFLTTSLNNMGSGLRLSALVHLPALALLNRLPETLQAAHHLGISVRGAHGEHSAAVGDLYQVSNAVTLGLTPDHIEGRVRPVVDYLIAAERAARREVAEMPEFAGRAVEDARAAWHYLERSERLSARDALEVLSRLRLAAACGLTPLGGAEPAPDASLFTALVVDLRTGADLTESATGGEARRKGVSSVRDALQRAARIRSALRGFYREDNRAELQQRGGATTPSAGRESSAGY